MHDNSSQFSFHIFLGRFLVGRAAMWKRPQQAPYSQNAMGDMETYARCTQDILESTDAKDKVLIVAHGHEMLYPKPWVSILSQADLVSVMLSCASDSMCMV